MNADRLREACREHAVRSVELLALESQVKFINAANLMEWRSPILAKVRALTCKDAAELWPLHSVFELICERYIATFYSPQRELITKVGDEPDELWWQYFVHVLVPCLMSNDDVVRNVLRAVNALPCRDPQEAARALEHHVWEMTLPGAQPAWAPK